ncbi:monosaccharide ABC transporter membrane protein, CUT2 family [Candidatus Pantoea symbiotica]|jgi:ribose transport system permease protein/AI-2 transport system permease protein|uniref:Autoinducer 2 import system permease protein LsrC n=1 Tax=Candidatus Pantoea symbiotica TaxID=1884370 RepID=A0A1I3ZND1_9GAMM|nr:MULTISPECIES: ABC transporter permease [Pantoea]KAJ9430059.1 ABC transporter permease [Pantoea sp. YR343]SFK45575.1 monosaccharide ABC transporter membrane protein, CUT2 family [Pantoea symbiotica]SFU92722.1 monosaccharide ABC transporter membrane protein, CUT2 family [Pantoea sp. YR525]
MHMTSREIALLAIALLASAGFSWFSPWFATVDNLLTILRNSSELLLIALGMTLVIAMGGVDVSVGVVMGVAAWGVGQLLLLQSPWLAAIGGPLLGLLLGLITALVVVMGRIPAIVGTLGLFGVWRTGLFALLGGQWLSGLPGSLTSGLMHPLLGLPVMAWVIVLVWAGVWLVLRHMPYGLWLLAAGNSEEKARLAGIPVTQVRIATFMISGLLCGIAATCYIATYRNVEMTVGGSLALEAIAAVVLGGTRITGGSCSLLGTLLGVLLLRILQNGLLLVGIPSLWQTVVTGAVLLIVLSSEAASGRVFAFRRIA